MLVASASGTAQQEGAAHTRTGERGVMLMNRIGPSRSELYIATSDGTGERKLFPGTSFDLHASYSPDGEWIVFTSERNGLGQADIYRARPDGTHVERLTDSPALDDQGALSPDGTQLAFVSTRESQTANVWILDFRTRKLRNLTGQPGLQGDPAKPNGFFRPAWSPDGRWIARDPNHEYRYTDVFPSFSKDGTLLLTRKDGDSSLDIMNPDGTNRREVFPSNGGEAFSPSWSPDGQWIVFGYGGFLQLRNRQPAKIMMVRRDGSNVTTLTDGTPNAGFPSWSPDGTRIVYRVWGEGVQGLRILNVSDRSAQVLTTDYDNLPYWSPDGQRIVFTRRHSGFNFDIFTIRPDGSDLRQLTTSPANDAHAVWTADGQHIRWSSGMYGWKEEAALYDRTFQPYGQIFIMKADGSETRQLTDSLWEDSMPQFVPKVKKGN